MSKAKIFISYSHKDEESREYLEEHLSVLRKQEKLSFWSDRQIELGEDWLSKITKELHEANIAILLLSRHFLSSEFIMDKEVPLLLERREKGELEILFLMLSPCLWEDVDWIKKLQGFPKDNRPLSGMSSHEKDEVLVEFVSKIHEKCKVQETKEVKVSKEPKDKKTLKEPFNVPFESKDDGAIGIEDKLIEVDKALSASKTTSIGQVASFQGIGGLGKTQLAVEYAHRYNKKYQGVVWLTMDQDIDDQLIDLAESTGWVGKEVDHKVKLDIAKERYAELQNTLLIYDNIEKYEEVEPYLPKAVNNKILITSRNVIQGFTSIPLNTLNKENSLKLLAYESQRIIQDDELQSAEELVQVLDGLPLALEMAGALVYSLDLNWNDYWENFQEEGVSFLDESDIRGCTKHESNISKTLSLGDKLLEENPILENIINLLAWGAPEPMDKVLLSQMMNEKKIKLAIPIQKGVKLKFIKEEDSEEEHKVYTLHRLVREVWKKQKKLDVSFANNVSYNLAGYMKKIKDDFLNLRELDMASFQAKIWAGYLKSDIQTQSLLICYSAYPDNYLGHFQSALESVNQAYNIIKNTEDSLAHAELLNSKAYLLSELGDMKEAKPYYEQAFEMRQRLYPDTDHSDMATSLNNMGFMLERFGEKKEAKFYYEQALEMRQRLYPDTDHPDIANSLNNMGFILEEFGEKKEAKFYYEQALEMRQRLYPDTDHPDKAISLSSMGSILEEFGDKKEAKFYYEQALEMRQRLYSDIDHPDISQSLNNLGVLYMNLKECEKAKTFFMKAEQSLERMNNDFNNLQIIQNNLKEIERNIKKEKKLRFDKRGRFCKDI